MKIVYVGDNRVRGNYGCRATSTALSLLLGKNHEIVGRITGAHTHFDTDNLVYIRWMPRCFYTFVGKLKCWKYLKRFLHLFIRMIKRGGKFYCGTCDFISHDMEKSIRNLKKLIPANASYSEFDLEQYDFDALVVNGEGSFIFSTPPWRESLVISMEIYWAQKLGKKVYFMNAMFSDDPKSQRNQKTIKLVDNLLSKCDLVVCREQTSLDYVHLNLPSVKPILIPDALFTWYDLVNDDHTIENLKYYIAHSAEKDELYEDVDFTKPYILIAASSAGIVQKNMNIPIKAYCNLVERTKKELGCKVYLIQVCEGDEFLNEVSKLTNTQIIPMDTPLVAAAKILSNAAVFISGRYHPSIMASLGGTPCVYMGSNSHKTRSIQELLQYEDVKEFEIIPNDEEITKILENAKTKIDAGEKLREKIKKRARELSIEASKMGDYVK